MPSSPPTSPQAKIDHERPIDDITATANGTASKPLFFLTEAQREQLTLQHCQEQFAQQQRLSQPSIRPAAAPLSSFDSDEWMVSLMGESTESFNNPFTCNSSWWRASWASPPRALTFPPPATSLGPSPPFTTSPASSILSPPSSIRPLPLLAHPCWPF